MARTYAPSPLRAIALAVTLVRQRWKIVRQRWSTAKLPPQIIYFMRFGLGLAQRAAVSTQRGAPRQSRASFVISWIATQR